MFVVSGSLVALDAHLATADAPFLASLILAMGALARIWVKDEQPGVAMTILFWAGLGLSMLLKGLIGPLAIGMTVVVLSLERGGLDWLRPLRPVLGLALLTALVVPSLIALSLSEPGVVPDEEHLIRLGVPFALSAPPGTYTLLLGPLVGPAATFFLLGVPWLVENPRRPPIFFALAWGAPLWLAMELLSEKHPQNVLPVLPAIAIVAAAAVDAGATRIGGWFTALFSIGLFMWPGALLAASVWAAVTFAGTGEVPTLAIVPFALAVALGVLAWLRLRQERPIASAVTAIGGAAIIYVGIFGILMPGLKVIRVAERVVSAGQTVARCANPSLAVAGFPEESVSLAAGQNVAFVDGAAAAQYLAGPGCKVAAVDGVAISSFRQRAEDLGIALSDPIRVTGFDFRKFRALDINVFAVDGGPASAP
jgi:4-amino-4-deoxy-L-arabinose transferase-like glycosyltransferase